MRRAEKVGLYRSAGDSTPASRIKGEINRPQQWAIHHWTWLQPKLFATQEVVWIGGRSRKDTFFFKNKRFLSKREIKSNFIHAQLKEL